MTRHTYKLKFKSITIVRDGISDYTFAKNFTKPYDVAVFVNTFARDLDDVEHFLVLCLDAKNTVLGVHRVAQGTVNGALMQPRETFRAAIMMNAVSVILAHTHPSGNPEPSKEDIAITRQLVEAGRVLDIRVLDHIVVGMGDPLTFVSLAERHLL